MIYESIARIAVLAGLALVATPLLHGDTAPYGQPVRQNWGAPQDAQSGQTATTPPTRQTNKDATAPSSSTRQFNWKVITPSDAQDSQTEQPKKNGNGSTAPSRPVNAPAATPLRQASPAATQAPANAMPQRPGKQATPSQGQNYWSPNQPQKMTGTDFDSSKKEQKSGSPAQAPSAPSSVKPTDATHPANYYKTEDKSLVQKAKENPSLSTFITALEAAGLADQIDNGGPFTIFAPSNEAFRQLPKGTLDRLLRPENQRDLYMIISYHIAPGKIEAKDAKTQSVRTLNGRDLDMQAGRGVLTVDDAEVIRQDIQGKNGVIHVIDAVLLPPNQ